MIISTEKVLFFEKYNYDFIKSLNEKTHCEQDDFLYKTFIQELAKTFGKDTYNRIHHKMAFGKNIVFLDPPTFIYLATLILKEEEF